MINLHGKEFSKGNEINLEKIFATHIKAKVDFPNTQSTPSKINEQKRTTNGQRKANRKMGKGYEKMVH